MLIFLSSLIAESPKRMSMAALHPEDKVRESSFQLYHESRWDPLVYDASIEDTDRLNQLKAESGFFREHNSARSEKITRFGDVSILTINLFREIVVDNETLQTAENIRTMLDEIHPTFMCLQGVDETLLARIHGKLKDTNHYMVATFEKSNADLLTGQANYFPIIYDTKMMHVTNSGYFETLEPKKLLYGSYLEVKDLRKPTDEVSFSVINIDMFSTFNDVVSAEFSNIVADINSFKEVEKKPVFMAGGMGTVPASVKEMMTTFKNTLLLDKNNEEMPYTTIHAGGQDDNIQRDFILFRDKNKVFELNYARILREFLAGDHYPVHAIFSYKNNKKVIQSPPPQPITPSNPETGEMKEEEYLPHLPDDKPKMSSGYQA